MTALVLALRRRGRGRDRRPHLIAWTTICALGALTGEAARLIGG